MVTDETAAQQAHLPERTRNRRTERAAVRTEAKADIFFALYCSLGAERSLALVSARAGEAGVPRSAKTLERYSADYHWQERVREYDERRAATVQHVALDQAIANDIQHAQIGRALQELAIAHVARHRALGTAAPLFGGTEIARLAAEGVRIERLASGQATEIYSVMIEFYGVLIGAFGNLWVESMDAAHEVYAERGLDQALRQRAHLAAQAVFGPGADRVLQEHFRAVNVGVPLLGQSGEGSAR